MLLDDVKAAHAHLTLGMPTAAQIVLGVAIADAEREPPADVVSVPRAVVLALADLAATFDPMSSAGDPDTSFGGRSCRLATALDAALGIPWADSWTDTADVLRALATAPRPEPADRLVGQVAPAAPAAEPVAVAGAATLADVEALRAEVDDLRRLLAQGLTIAGRRLDGSAGPSLVDLARNLSCPSPSR